MKALAADDGDRNGKRWEYYRPTARHSAKLESRFFIPEKLIYKDASTTLWLNVQPWTLTVVIFEN